MKEKIIMLGDCKDIIPGFQDKSIQACITSPPYAEQRKQYNSIKEKNYPQWTVDWMEELKPKLKENGSVLIVIRSHIRNGEVSDYVMKTRLAIREAGWIECEELLWQKLDAPPLGSFLRPRRSWENILWFSPSRKPFIDLKACGNTKSTRTGGFAGSDRFAGTKENPVSEKQNRKLLKGTSRITDVFQALVGGIIPGIMHPAMFPPELAEKLIKTFSQENDLIFDPFMGAGTTAYAAEMNNRRWIGTDTSEEYIKEAQKVIQLARRQNLDMFED